MTELPTASALGLSPESVVAIVVESLTVYRLVASNPPTPRDFQAAADRAHRAS